MQSTFKTVKHFKNSVNVCNFLYYLFFFLHVHKKNTPIYVYSFSSKNPKKYRKTITRRINQIICNFFVLTSLINSLIDRCQRRKTVWCDEAAIYLRLFRYQSIWSPKSPANLCPLHHASTSADTKIFLFPR